MKAVSGKDLAKALERKGWTHTRTRGSHHVYASPDGQTIAVVPIHGNQTLPIGTQRGIMKDAGLTEADL